MRTWRWASGLLLSFLSVGLFMAAAHAENIGVTIGVGDTILQVSGQTSPNAFVTISRDGSIIGTTTANSAGIYTQTFPAQTPGLHQISIFAHSTGGENTDTVTVTVNIAEFFTTTVQVFLPSTLVIADASLDYNQRLELSGETFPNSTVSIYIDDSTYATATSNAQGAWSISLDTAALSPGQHNVFVRVTDAFGAQSYPTSPRQFTLGAKPGGPAPIPPGPSQAPSIPIITYPSSGTVVQQPTITVRGTADPNNQIEIWEDGRIIGSVWSDAFGNWHFDMRLQPRGYAIKARACLLQVCSAFSPVVYFSYQPAGGAVPTELPLQISSGQYSFCAYQNEPVTLEALVLDGQPPYKTTLQWDAQVVDTATFLQNALQFTHRYSKAGRYTVTLTVTDAQGRTGQAQFTVQVVERHVSSVAGEMSLLVWVLLTLLGWYLYRRWKANKERKREQKNHV